MGASLPNRCFNAMLILDGTALTVSEVNYCNTFTIAGGKYDQSKLFSRGTDKTRVGHVGFFNLIKHGHFLTDSFNHDKASAYECLVGYYNFLYNIRYIEIGISDLRFKNLVFKILFGTFVDAFGHDCNETTEL